MAYTKKEVQNANMVLITFMIIFGIVGLIVSQKSDSEKTLQQLDAQLDQYEIELTEYQNQLENEKSNTSGYGQKYAEYEAKYDEYMKLYEQRQELYQTYKEKATGGITLNSSVLYLGIGVLLVIMIYINTRPKK